MIEKKCFVELSAKEIESLSEIPHCCVFFNWLHNSNSSSSPFRMVCNTSAVSNQTTLSTEQMAPTNVLSPQENVIVRFQLFPVLLCRAPWQIGTLKYFEIEIKKCPSRAMQGKWGQIGPNGTKRDQTEPNWTKRGQMGPNGVKQG